MNSPGLPDSIGAADLPGNSLAAAHQEAHWEANRREVEAQAWRDLDRLCAIPGPVRNEYLEYIADHGHLSTWQYASLLEQTNAARWQRTVNAIWQTQFNDPEAA